MGNTNLQAIAVVFLSALLIVGVLVFLFFAQNIDAAVRVGLLGALAAVVAHWFGVNSSGGTA